MKNYKYERYTIRLNDQLNDFIKELAVKRSIPATTLIKNILGEYKESYDRQAQKDYTG